MRVTSDRQTLILAGETPPRRGRIASDRPAGTAQDSSDDTESSTDGRGSSRLTIISARLDAIVTQGIYTPTQKSPVSSASSVVIDASSSGAQLGTLAPASPAAAPAPPAVHQVFVVSSRGASSAANAYARTRDLADKAPAIIDTYA